MTTGSGMMEVGTGTRSGVVRRTGAVRRVRRFFAGTDAAEKAAESLHVGDDVGLVGSKYWLY